jgi:MoaA/NifB/PqqE/SkfB family radical SAM enzyme
VDHKAEVKEMNTEQLLGVVDELADLGTKMIVFLGGEFSIVKDIEKVIDRIIARGMVCDAVTNALLLPKKISVFKKLDSLCISMDGIGESNDVTRGKGTSKKILDSIELAKKEGMVIRINCVVTKNNMNTYQELLKWAKKENALVTFGMPFEDEIKDMLLDEQEMRTFYKNLKRLKKEGYPVLFSDEAIEYMEKYPGSPADFITQSQKEDRNINNRYKKKCPYGRFIAYVHSDGMMLPCNNLYKIRNNGPNILEIGAKRAWENIGSLDCLSCYEAGIPEWNFLTSYRGIWKGALITFKQLVNST